MSDAIRTLHDYLAKSPSVVYPQDVLEFLPAIKAENVKLRELVSGLTWCAEHTCRKECPLHDKSEPDHCREMRLKQELGIEAQE